MKQETKVKLRNYGICVAIEVLIAFLVIWSKGFFTDRASVNVQILADAFFVSGILMTLFAGMMYVSSEGALLGIGYIGQCVAQAFVPMGRKNHESYASYRERKIGQIKKPGDNCILVVGLIFFLTGVIFTVIWYKKYFNVV